MSFSILKATESVKSTASSSWAASVSDDEEVIVKPSLSAETYSESDYSDDYSSSDEYHGDDYFSDAWEITQEELETERNKRQEHYSLAEKPKKAPKKEVRSPDKDAFPQGITFTSSDKSWGAVPKAEPAKVGEDAALFDVPLVLSKAPEIKREVIIPPAPEFNAYIIGFPHGKQMKLVETERAFGDLFTQLNVRNPITNMQYMHIGNGETRTIVFCPHSFFEDFIRNEWYFNVGFKIFPFKFAEHPVKPAFVSDGQDDHSVWITIPEEFKAFPSERVLDDCVKRLNKVAYAMGIQPAHIGSSNSLKKIFDCSISPKRSGVLIKFKRDVSSKVIETFQFLMRGIVWPTVKVDGHPKNYAYMVGWLTDKRKAQAYQRSQSDFDVEQGGTPTSSFQKKGRRSHQTSSSSSSSSSPSRGMNSPNDGTPRARRT